MYSEQSKILSASHCQGDPNALDAFQKLSHIVNTCILQSDFKQVNLYSQEDIMLQIQHFLTTLDLVSFNLENVTRIEYYDGSFSTAETSALTIDEHQP